MDPAFFDLEVQPAQDFLPPDDSGVKIVDYKTHRKIVWKECQLPTGAFGAAGAAGAPAKEAERLDAEVCLGADAQGAHKPRKETSC